MITNLKMKKTKSLLLGVATMMAFAPFFTSCDDDMNGKVMTTIDLQHPPLSYNDEGVWTGWCVNLDLYNNGFTFSHTFTDYGGGMGISNGFVATRSTDNTYHEPMYAHQFNVMTQGGVNGPGTPCLVANWDTMGTDDVELADRCCLIVNLTDRVKGFRPAQTYVTNTCYAYYTMLNGNDFCRPFAKGDRLTLTAHGVHADGSESTTSFYLADMVNGDPATEIVRTWKSWDLTPLGEVICIYFTMDSTDSGQWGMNTPAYFALDGLTVELIME